MFAQTMPSNIKFLEPMRYLRFDLKIERRRKSLHDKFALDSQLQHSFLENFQKVFFPQQVLHYRG